jgi:cell division transport system permease protein
MQLVGATRGFIRKPFIFRGILWGIYASIVAMGLIGGIIYFLQGEFSNIISLHDIEIIALLFSSVLLTGIVFSWMSTYIAVNKYLKINPDKLYY